MTEHSDHTDQADPTNNKGSRDLAAADSRHANSYSDKGFWDKVGRFAQSIGSTGLYYALVLYYALKDDSVPFAHKALIMGALGYLILPLDAIPDALLGVGFTDDAGVMLAALRAISGSVTPEHLRLAEEQLKTWFPHAKPAFKDVLK